MSRDDLRKVFVEPRDQDGDVDPDGDSYDAYFHQFCERSFPVTNTTSASVVQAIVEKEDGYIEIVDYRWVKFYHTPA